MSAIPVNPSSLPMKPPSKKPVMSFTKAIQATLTKEEAPEKNTAIDLRVNELRRRFTTETAEEQQLNMLRDLRIREVEEEFKALTQTVNPHLDVRKDDVAFNYVEHHTHHRSQKSKVQDYSKDLSDESSHDEKEEV
jgi:hypothetical protein